MRLVLATLTAALIVSAAACTSSAPSSTAKPVAATPTAGAPAAVAFGHPVTLTAPAGVAELTVTTPTVETFHAAVYDTTCKIRPADCAKPSHAGTDYVIVQTSWTGTEGSVDVDQAYEFEYEQPDGTLVSSTDLLEVFEPLDALSAHPSTVGAGQKTGGAIVFESGIAGGRVIVQTVPDGDTAVTFATVR